MIRFITFPFDALALTFPLRVRSKMDFLRELIVAGKAGVYGTCYGRCIKGGILQYGDEERTRPYIPPPPPFFFHAVPTPLSA